MASVTPRRPKVDEEEVSQRSNVVLVGSCRVKAVVVVVIALRCALGARTESCCWFVAPLELLYRFHVNFFSLYFLMHSLHLLYVIFVSFSIFLFFLSVFTYIGISLHFILCSCWLANCNI